MNDIMYRAKRMDNGELIYGYPYVLAAGTPYEQTFILEPLDKYGSIYDVGDHAYEVIPETLERNFH